MPLHKSTRGPRLDPTMISAPLGDFRHTMHIGRGGDAFGDTSFLSTLGPSSPPPEQGSAATVSSVGCEMSNNHNDGHMEAAGCPENNEHQHCESVSSFTLDLDLDLGPSMLGDVLGVMDGLSLDCNEEDVFSPKSDASLKGVKQGMGETETCVDMQNELNGCNFVGSDQTQVGNCKIADGNGNKLKGIRPKVRFSDKREEIIRLASEEEGFDFQDEEDQLVCQSPMISDGEVGKGSVGGSETETRNLNVELPPSPASSHSFDYEVVTPLDRRRVESCHTETESEEEEEEEEEETGRGYTFEDEFDDEIGL